MKFKRLSHVLLKTILLVPITASAATFTVTKTADTNDGVCDADCSLREAISASNVNVASDTIQFDPIVFASAQTIVLSGTQLEVAEFCTLIITGPGPSLLTISGNNLSRVVLVNAQANVSLSGAKIANGRLIDNEDGAGLRNQVGTVALSNVTFENNVTNSEGGAIYNVTGNLTITNGTFIGNSAGVEGGAIDSDTFVSTIPVITISNSSFTNNSTSNFAGGALSGFYTLTVSDSTFTGNTAPSGGAAVGGSYTNCTFINNVAQTLHGGALLGTTGLTNSFFQGNSAARRGGAVYFDEGSIQRTITGTTFTGNSAQDGGAIYNFRQLLVVSGSTFSNNTASRDAGAFFNDATGASSSINSSSIIDNSAVRNGGGLVNWNSTLNVSNSLVKGNVASATGGEGGGGIYLVVTTNITNSTIVGNSTSSRGGGIFDRGGAANLTNVTISGNQANTGGGVAFESISADQFRSRNSIFADNSATTSGPDFNGTLTSQGYNLIEKTSGTAVVGTTSGNILGLDPLLRPLKANGGPTQTVGLGAGSPAIDAGDPTTFPSADQRGIARPQNGDLSNDARPDIGAYEKQLTVLTVTKVADTNDGVCDSDCSLREAVANTVPANAPDFAIVFDPSVFSTPQTILLQNTHITFSDRNVLVSGPGSNLLSISGNDLVRAFIVRDRSSVEMRGLTITNGRQQFESGGGLINSISNLKLSNVVISHCSATEGGGISNEGGFVQIVTSTISGNSTTGAGGGILTRTSGQDIGGLLLNDVVVSGNTSFRDGAGVNQSASPVTILASTFTNNTVTGAGFSGGALYASGGDVSISDSGFFVNTAGNGGAIRASGLSNKLSLLRVLIEQNTADFGGGIRFDSGNLTISESLFSANVANNRGGGLLINQGTAAISNSSFYRNIAHDDGGGLASFANLTMYNSTVSDNSADDFGGGIYSDNNANLSYSTISNNNATGGGGIINVGSISISGMLVADNTATQASKDFSGTANSLGYNLIENATGATISGNLTGNITGQDPRLGPLSSTGGPTLTRPLMLASPAIDAGNPSSFPATDQRGFTRPLDGNQDLVSRADIGAFEVRPVFVTNTNDSGTGSLRQAIFDTAFSFADHVLFDAGRFSSPQLITLSGGDLVIPMNKIVFIDGRDANKVTISGNNQSRVLTINQGAFVAINGITFTGGNGVGALNSGHDGSISNWGTLSLSNSIVRNNISNGNAGGIGTNLNSNLTLENCIVRENSASTIAGGGIFVQNSTATVRNSTLNNNSAAGVGGGIASIFGNVQITNSTISGNTSGNGGGGISNFTASSVLRLDHATIAGNRTIANSGGGINNTTGGSVTARNSLVANNLGTSADFSGPLTSDGYNLIEDVSGTSITGNLDGNILSIDPKLDPILRSAGSSTPTHALGSGSAAIDKGAATNPSLTTDQRGKLRPFNFSSIPNASGGNGSDIGAFERQQFDLAFPAAPFDYDGDGKSDISVWRPSDGVWYIIQSGSSSVRAQGWGLNGDKLAPADFDGDGKTDLSVFRESDSNWYIFNSATSTVTTAGWGLAGDLPVPADYGGDGKADLAVYRPSEGKWYRRDSDGKLHIYEWGLPGDKPAPADFNGDGVADMTVFRPSEGKWYILNSGNASISEFTWGLNGDVPVPGDYSGDGKADFAVFRPSNQTWYRIHSDTFQIHIITWGLPGDFPTPGDYDGDGRNDLAVFRPSNSTWFINSSTGGIYSQPFGLTGDIPVENAFVY